MAKHHRKRWLIGAGVAVGIVAVLVGVGIAVWAGRGPSRPSVGEAVRRFRSSENDAHVALLPRPGVYLYAGTGAERLSFLDTHQSQEGTLPGTVTVRKDGCWTFAIQYNSFHRQTWNRCAVDGRLYEHGGTTDQKFDFGVLSQSEHSEVVCDPPTEFYAPGRKPGKSVAVRCTGHSRTTKSTLVQRGRFRFVGRTKVLVGTKRVPALHFAQDVTISKDQQGRNREELWLAASDGLPLRERRSLTVVSPAPAPLNQVTYTETGEWRLLSRTPRT